MEKHSLINCLKRGAFIIKSSFFDKWGNINAANGKIQISVPSIRDGNDGLWGINADVCHSFERRNLKLCAYNKYSKNNIENVRNMLF